MKSISASIIALAGAVIFSAGSLKEHADTEIAVCIVGALVAVEGLRAWFRAVSRNDP